MSADADALSDSDFLAAMEAATFPFEQWTHQAHVRLAAVVALASGLSAAADDCPETRASALDRVRRIIQAFNGKHSEKLRVGYHETITHWWFHRVADAIIAAGVADGDETALQRALRGNPRLGTSALMFDFYSRDRLFNDGGESRAAYVEPDLAPPGHA